MNYYKCDKCGEEITSQYFYPSDQRHVIVTDKLARICGTLQYEGKEEAQPFRTRLWAAIKRIGQTIYLRKAAGTHAGDEASEQ